MKCYDLENGQQTWTFKKPQADPLKEYNIFEFPLGSLMSDDVVSKSPHYDAEILQQKYLQKIQ